MKNLYVIILLAMLVCVGCSKKIKKTEEVKSEQQEEAKTEIVSNAIETDSTSTQTFEIIEFEAEVDSGISLATADPIKEIFTKSKKIKGKIYRKVKQQNNMKKAEQLRAKEDKKSNQIVTSKTTEVERSSSIFSELWFQLLVLLALVSGAIYLINKFA